MKGTNMQYNTLQYSSNTFSKFNFVRLPYGTVPGTVPGW